MRVLHLTDGKPGVPGGRETHIRAFCAESNTLGNFNSSACVAEALSADFRRASDNRPDVILLHSHDAWIAAKQIRRAYEGSVVMAWVHDQSFVCAASISWFRNTRTECWLPLGAHCVINAYTRHCNSRRPDRNLGNCARVKASLDAISSMDGIIVASRYMLERLVAGGVPQARIHVLPYFVAGATNPVRAPQSSGTRRVLYVGRLNETKGVDVLIRAMAHLPKQYGLDVVGSGYTLGELKSLAEEIDSSPGRINFAGQVTDEKTLRQAYCESDVVAVPSLWPEPFGIVGLEAMQNGVPVVASRVGGIPEWLLDGETGYLTKPDDPRDLAAKLQHLLENDALRIAFGERSQSHVRDNYSWERHWSRFQQIIDTPQSP